MKEFDSLLKSLTKRSFHSLLHFIFSLQIEALSHFGLRAKSQSLSQNCTKPPDSSPVAFPKDHGTTQPRYALCFPSFLLCFIFPNTPVLGPLGPLGTAPPLHEDTLLCKSLRPLPHLSGAVQPPVCLCSPQDQPAV